MAGIIDYAQSSPQFVFPEKPLVAIEPSDFDDFKRDFIVFFVKNQSIFDAKTQTAITKLETDPTIDKCHECFKIIMSDGVTIKQTETLNEIIVTIEQKYVTNPNYKPLIARIELFYHSLSDMIEAQKPHTVLMEVANIIMFTHAYADAILQILN